MKDHSHYAAGCFAEADRLRQLGQSATRNAERLKDYLKRNLDLLGISKTQGAWFRVTVCNNSRPSIAFEGDLAELPAEMRTVAVSANTQAAYEAWKRGEQLPQGFTVNQCRHLRIT